MQMTLPTKELAKKLQLKILACRRKALAERKLPEEDLTRFEALSTSIKGTTLRLALLPTIEITCETIIEEPAAINYSSNSEFFRTIALEQLSRFNFSDEAKEAHLSRFINGDYSLKEVISQCQLMAKQWPHLVKV
jgi:hypothetical protein